MIKNIIAVVLMVFVAGCASLETEPVYMPQTKYSRPTLKANGVYHKVQRGQTLWRIAKAYNLTINEIILANNIPNAANIEKNQLIFIPGAEKTKKIITETTDNQKDFVWPVEERSLSISRTKEGTRQAVGSIYRFRKVKKLKQPAREGLSLLLTFRDIIKRVILDHEDGFYSVYAQNSKLFVKLGDYIFKNTPIAVVGSKGKRLALLHFEIRKNSKEDNPLYYLP